MISKLTIGMKRTIKLVKEKYTASSGFAALIITLILAFGFQFMRLFAGHDDGYIVKTLKIGTITIFLIWSYIYIKKNERDI